MQYMVDNESLLDRPVLLLGHVWKLRSQDPIPGLTAAETGAGAEDPDPHITEDIAVSAGATTYTYGLAAGQMWGLHRTDDPESPGDSAKRLLACAEESGALLVIGDAYLEPIAHIATKIVEGIRYYGGMMRLDYNLEPILIFDPRKDTLARVLEGVQRYTQSPAWTDDDETL